MYPKGNLRIPATHGHLEAILKMPRTERKGVALVCHPHPLGGGTMHNKVVYRAAAGLADAGLAALRFNFRGVGDSTGDHDEGDGERQDVLDALDYLSANFPGEPITLAGFSFGSRVGTEIGMDDDRVTRLISLGTPVDKYTDYDFLENLKKPILFVHGDKDEFGSIENLNELVAKVSQVTDTEVIVFQNCGHFFDDHLAQLRDAIHDWVLEKIAESALAA
ncbi:MAG: alpha/beta fold hydrolase [Acidobacteria bacterium]|nr:MAG: alpha/beta fold hydrolase [Acidobacteriota bacterium]REK03041.1 MAG: alpha/beta fold hydrolase [Acidobacteriota bacterium]REK13155.1 MAG: alpha/beta fold hydrolase [Acidobacteriota bacterium]REK41149.1 MAG: alpha/beta fold hydrolase [Acidobacteriota bacterium]